MHHGDDLQQGLLLHALKGKEWYIQTKTHTVHPCTYKIDVCEEAVTATDVPVHWFHMHDLWPRSLLKYARASMHGSRPPALTLSFCVCVCARPRYAPARCSCGEPSLFLQRGKGWDLSRQRFLFKYLRVRVRIIFSFFHPLTNTRTDHPGDACMHTSVCMCVCAAASMCAQLNSCRSGCLVGMVRLHR
jgi:hypothetical protein